MNAEEFLSAVANRGASALAIKPVTLKFLLNVFRARSELPRTRWEIYEQGCRKLCEENNDWRKTHKNVGNVPWSRRIAIASRIAAICILGSRATIYLDSDPGGLADDTLLSEVFAGKQERDHGKEFDVNEAEVQETLTMTGLFNERGKSQLLGWAHQTYAEFLTARFLRERGFGLRDLGGILYPATDRIQIVPGLREVAAWLASTDVEIFRQLIEHDPQTLLQSDVAMVDDIERKKLVNALLEGFEARQLLDYKVGGAQTYRRLQHSSLSTQLEPWIRGKHRDWMARRAAIDIAEACNVQALQGALADVALDSTDNVNTRVQATHAVVTIGDVRTLQRLRPLAHGQAGDDPDDELRGLALRALWPKHMSAQEMFQCLTQPRRKLLTGVYRVFLSNVMKGNGFSNTDLAYALDWVVRQPKDHDPFDPFGELADSVLDEAWARMDDPIILHAVVHLADVKFRRHEHPFRNREKRQGKGELPHTDDESRKRFLVALIESTAPFEHDYWTLEINALLSPQDIPWMIQQLRQDSLVAQRWAALIEVALRHGGYQFEFIDAIAKALPQHQALRDACWWLAPTELGSAREAEERAAWASFEEEMAKRERYRAEHGEVLLDPPPIERVRRSLDRFEQGRLNVFWQMQAEMWLRPTSTHYEDRYEADLSKSPGWHDADATTRGRIMAAAKQYILARGPNSRKWLGKHDYHDYARVGYRAFFLLVTQAPQLLETLPCTVWQCWASAIVGYPSGWHDQDTSSRHRQLVGMAYRNAPAETFSTLNVLIDRDNRQHNEIFIIRELGNCWDARLGEFFLEKAKDPSLKASVLGFLLDDLLQRNVAGVREYAASLLDLRFLQKKKFRRRARAAAEALFRQPTDAGWPILQPPFLVDPPFGYKVALGAAARMDTYMRNSLRWPSLSENELADFFLWLYEQFPKDEDRSLFSARGRPVTARDTVGELRGTALSALSKRGTQAAVDAIRTIEQILPNDDSIRFVRVEAEQHTLAGTRRLLSPTEVIDLRPRSDSEAISKETTTMAKSNRLVERCDVLLMTATEIETRAVLAVAERETQRKAQIIPGKIKMYHSLGTISESHVYLVQSEVGAKTQGGSTSTTLRAIWELNPLSVVMVGIAFGVDPQKQSIGSILVSEHLQDYELVRYGTDERTGTPQLRPRGVRVPSSPRSLNALRTAKLTWDDGKFEPVDFGLMLSGDKLIDHVDFRSQLVDRFPEARGGEMEAIGVYVASEEEKKDWIIVKAICDYADGNKHQDKAQRQKFAAERAASFVFHAIAQGGFAPRE